MRNAVLSPRRRKPCRQQRYTAAQARSVCVDKLTARNVELIRMCYLEVEENHFRASAILAITRTAVRLVQEVIFVCVHLHEKSDDDCFVYTQFGGIQQRSSEEDTNIRREKNVHSSRPERRRRRRSHSLISPAQLVLTAIG